MGGVWPVLPNAREDDQSAEEERTTRDRGPRARGEGARVLRRARGRDGSDEELFEQLSTRMEGLERKAAEDEALGGKRMKTVRSAKTVLTNHKGLFERSNPSFIDYLTFVRR